MFGEDLAPVRFVADLIEFVWSIEWMDDEGANVLLVEDGEFMMNARAIECANSFNCDDDLMRSTFLINDLLYAAWVPRTSFRAEAIPPRVLIFRVRISRVMMMTKIAYSQLEPVDNLKFRLPGTTQRREAG